MRLRRMQSLPAIHQASLGFATAIRPDRQIPHRCCSFLLYLGLAVAVIGAFAHSASAAGYTPRTYESQISLSRPEALTTDSSNQLWVSEDSGGGAFVGLTSEFNVEGEKLPTSFLHSWENHSLADDYANNDIYEAAGGAIYVYSSSGVQLSKVSSVEPRAPLWVAVNTVGGATAGRVYVDGANVVESLDENLQAVNFSRFEEPSPPSYIKANRLTGTPTGPFTDSGSVAVGLGGVVYVADTGKVDEFESSGVFVREIAGADAPGGFSPGDIAVDPSSGDLLVVSGTKVDEFSPSGSYLGQVTGAETPSKSFLTVGGIAVNSSGYLYVSDYSNGSNSEHHFVDVFSPSVILPKVTYPGVSGAAEISPTESSATLNAEVNPEGGGAIDTCKFEYVTEADYRPSVQNPFEAGHSVPCSQALPYSGPSTLAASAVMPSIIPGTVYRYRAVVGNSNGIRETPIQSFDLQAPTLSKPSASNLTATTADLDVKINPQGADSTYHFEYGTTTSYGESVPVPDGDVGSFGTEHQIAVHLTELKRVTYHFRVVAENMFGITKSEDQSFSFYPPQCPNAHVRQQTGAEFLPDCRAYELVSPADAGGTLLYPVGPNSSEATNPSRFAFGGILGRIPGPGDPADVLGDLYVSTRTDSGWTTRYVGPPGSAIPTSNGPPSEEEFGLDGIERSPGGQLTDLTMDTFMSWSDGDEAYAYGEERGVAGSYAPYLWDAEGGSLGRLPTDLGAVPTGEGLRGAVEASPDFSHYFFTSEGELDFAPGAPAGSAYDDNLAENTVQVISKKTDGEPFETARGAITFPYHGSSTNGSRVLMATPGSEAGAEELYMRVGGGMGLTYELAPGHAVRYVGMTSDASKVYFTSVEKLTSEAEDTSTNLYMWSERSAAEGKDPLTLISKPDGAATTGTPSCPATSWTTECSVVPYPVGGPTTSVSDSIENEGQGGNGHSDNAIAAETGDIYFYSPQQLDSSKGTSGQQNLYVYRNGQVQYVTTFTTGPFCSPEYPYPCSPGPMARIQVSPDDSHMAFLTASRITSYENAGHLEMYTYDPASQDIQCASCIPGGAPPTTNVEASDNGLFMTNDGRVFFSTGDSLVPQDTDGLRDVYEYVEGRPQLISSGTSSQDEGLAAHHKYLLHTAGLASVSANGTDVYFSTFDPLVAQDHNGTSLRFYDARSGGGFSTSPPSSSCSAADECAGPGNPTSSPPQMGTGANLGNLGNRIPTAAGHWKSKQHKHKRTRRKRAAKQNRGGRK